MKVKAVLAVVVLMGVLGRAQDKGVSIATMTPGSIFHSSSTALAKLANEKAGIRTTIQPFASPNVFIPAINSGEIEFGFGNLYEAVIGYEGAEYFNGRANKNLRAVAITYPIPSTIYVRKDSPYKTLSDLKGLRGPDGYSSQKFMLHVTDAIYATSGLTRADFKPVYVPNIIGSADAFAAGKMDFFSYSIHAAKVREVEAAVGGLRAISLDHSPEAVQRMQKYFSVAYLRRIEPASDNVAITEPVYCITHDGLLFASAKASDDVVYKITKVMYENKADLVATFAMFKHFEPNEMVKKIPIPYHPGAIKFYKEVGLWPPK